MLKKKKLFVKIVALLLSFCILLLGVAVDINTHIVSFSSKYTLLTDEAANLNNVDCILVLGCGIWGDRPSHLLEDRLLRCIELYNHGVSDKILLSGDHGKKDYDEVNVMRTYIEENGNIPTEQIFMDHAGFSTYESMYRAKEIFCAKKIVIVTQQYHLSRAIYIARSLGLDAYGVSSDYRPISGQAMRDAREVLAREKDFFYCLFKPKPTYLGEQIPISGSGTVTAG